MTKYLKDKSGKITGIIWEEKGEAGGLIVGAAVILAVVSTAYIWWKTKEVN